MLENTEDIEVVGCGGFCVKDNTNRATNGVLPYDLLFFKSIDGLSSGLVERGLMHNRSD